MNIFNWLFGTTSLKRLVMKKVNEQIAVYQKRLDDNLAEMKVNRAVSLGTAFDEYLNKRESINRDYEYNKAKIVDTHVTNLLGKII